MESHKSRALIFYFRKFIGKSLNLFKRTANILQQNNLQPLQKKSTDLFLKQKYKATAHSNHPHNSTEILNKTKFSSFSFLFILGKKTCRTKFLYHEIFNVKSILNLFNHFVIPVLVFFFFGSTFIHFIRPEFLNNWFINLYKCFNPRRHNRKQHRGGACIIL